MHRKELIQQLRAIYLERKNVLLVGSAGIGKTAFLQEIRQALPLQICEETSSLDRICDRLEHQIGWGSTGLSIIERKNRLLHYLEQRHEPIAFDHVAETPPRVARFIAHLIQHVPIWIACRSDRRKEVGHIWEHLYNFTLAGIRLGSLSKWQVLRRPRVNEDQTIDLSPIQCFFLVCHAGEE